jgi:8-oxo-dGTP pyrophosphatase MutT (NUDIX family)
VSEQREAAVAFGILTDEPHGVIFIERAAHLRDHPGQIGLPGGGVDPIDEGDHARAALRELREEVGVEAGRVTIIDRLPTVRPRFGRHAVTPFVALIAPGPLVIDPSETAAVFTIPLATILERRLEPGIVHFAEREISTPVLDYDGYRVWGMTARILELFFERWDDDRSGLRARVERALNR